MIRGFVLLLVVGVLFSVSGCMMSEIMGLKKKVPVGYEPKFNLSANENHALKTWSRAAELADDVGDCTTAILYYTKIMDYFPDTKEGARARKRLDEIRGKPYEAKEENSL